MPQDNDIIILQLPNTFVEERPKQKRKPRRKPREKVQTGLIKNIRMDIEELNELKGSTLRNDTRTDIFLGDSIDNSQKQNIYKQGKVYVRGHTKKVNNKIIVIKPHLRNK